MAGEISPRMTGRANPLVGIVSSPNSPNFTLTAKGPGHVPFAIKGVTSQTANLQTWIVGNTEVAKIESGGIVNVQGGFQASQFSVDGSGNVNAPTYQSGGGPINAPQGFQSPQFNVQTNGDVFAANYHNYSGGPAYGPQGFQASQFTVDSSGNVNAPTYQSSGGALYAPQGFQSPQFSADSYGYVNAVGYQGPQFSIDSNGFFSTNSGYQAPQFSANANGVYASTYQSDMGGPAYFPQGCQGSQFSIDSSGNVFASTYQSGGGPVNAPQGFQASQFYVDGNGTVFAPQFSGPSSGYAYFPNGLEAPQGFQVSSMTGNVLAAGFQASQFTVSSGGEVLAPQFGGTSFSMAYMPYGIQGPQGFQIGTNGVVNSPQGFQGPQGFQIGTGGIVNSPQGFQASQFTVSSGGEVLSPAFLTATRASAPASPAAGYVTFYTLTADGGTKLYSKDSGGTVRSVTLA